MKRVIVFMVAGMSSRFGGTIPKQFAKVGPNDETLIEISVNDALTQSFDEIVFITNPKTEHLFVNLFGSLYQNIPVFYIQQKMEEFRIRPWGTTDAVCSILEYDNFFMDSIFTIINGDDLYGKKAFQKMTELFVLYGWLLSYLYFKIDIKKFEPNNFLHFTIATSQQKMIDFE